MRTTKEVKQKRTAGGKRTKRKTMRREAKMIIAIFALWMLFSGVFLAKIVGPTMDIASAKDNYVFSAEYGNPYNVEPANEAYADYKDCVNSYINSDDAIVSFYAKQDGSFKMLLIMVAVIPYVILAWIISIAFEEYKKASRQRGMKIRTSKAIRQAARV